MFAPPYLNRLGLDVDADERAIKRAYARELKQIDQETDAAGFQTLREAYEMALEWARYQPADASFAPASTVDVPPAAVHQADVHPRPVASLAAAPARDADTGESAPRLGQAVFDDFLAICSEMAAQGDARDALLWRKHLQRCASDDRLLNIAARAHFEFFVARMLADGWHDGHEALFIAARQVFGWDKDRRRLLEFGQLGAWLNQAIDECEMFTHQRSGDCAGQTDAITRVRESAAPGKGELIVHAPHLRNMAARFPAWTAIIASKERIEQWIEMEQAIPNWRRRLRFTRPASSTAESGGSRWWIGILIVVAIRALFALSGQSHTAEEQRPWSPPRLAQPSAEASAQEQQAEALYLRAAGNLYMPPGTRRLDLMAQSLPPAPLPPPRPPPPRPPPPRPPPPQGRFLNDAEMKAISKRVQFEWSHTADRTYKVAFEVELDEYGRIVKMTTKTPSGLPVLDRDVEEAIRASAPFGAQIRRRFGLEYSWRRGHAKQPTAPKAAPEASDEAPATTSQAPPRQQRSESLQAAARPGSALPIQTG